MNLLPKAIESVRNGVGAVLEAQLDGTDGKYAGRSGKLVANGDAGVEGPACWIETKQKKKWSNPSVISRKPAHNPNSP